MQPSLLSELTNRGSRYPLRLQRTVWNAKYHLRDPISRTYNLRDPISGPWRLVMRYNVRTQKYNVRTLETGDEVQCQDPEVQYQDPGDWGRGTMSGPKSTMSGPWRLGTRYNVRTQKYNVRTLETGDSPCHNALRVNILISHNFIHPPYDINYISFLKASLQSRIYLACQGHDGS